MGYATHKSANPFSLNDIIENLDNQEDQLVYGKLKIPIDSTNLDKRYVNPRLNINGKIYEKNEKFEKYPRPLIQGELYLPTRGGLPAFARLNKVAVEKVLPPLES